MERSLFYADSGINDAVENVHQGVDDHHNGSDIHDGGLKQRKITARDGSRDDGTEPRDGEHGLDDDAARQDVRDQHGHDGQHGDQGVPEDVAVDHRPLLQALAPGSAHVVLVLYSSTEEKLTTLKEYVSRMKENQDKIFYACGESVSKINTLPQVENIKDKGYEILYLTEYVDEFSLQVLMEYEGKKFINICSEEVDMDTKEEKEELEKKNKDNKKMFDVMLESLDNEIKEIRFTNKLKTHPVCLSTKGNVSVEMEKVINAMPTDDKVKSEKVLEINENHPISKKLEKLYKTDKEELEKYSKILYAEARLIEGLPVDNQAEISKLICDIIS